MLGYPRLCLKGMKDNDVSIFWLLVKKAHVLDMIFCSRETEGFGRKALCGLWDMGRYNLHTSLESPYTLQPSTLNAFMLGCRVSEPRSRNLSKKP